MSLALPLSIQSVFTLGKISVSNSAQCGQVIEAYSKMVMGALALPSTMSFWASVGASAARAIPTEARTSTVATHQIFRICLSNPPDVDATASFTPLQDGAGQSMTNLP